MTTAASFASLAAFSSNDAGRFLPYRTVDGCGERKRRGAERKRALDDVSLLRSSHNPLTFTKGNEHFGQVICDDVCGALVSCP
mmetsp:Transcript_7376/g.15313  ORF Transcript_7376/g.15313 Transcript_7376/m.15313 type:complete len:83 (+) Transcript_7376:340-588(+)